MNWYKKADIDITDIYLNIVTIIKNQAIEYGLIFNNGDFISPSSNKIRLFVSDPEERYRYVINIRVLKGGVDIILFSLNSVGNLFTKEYQHHDFYKIIDESLSIIVKNINSIKGV